MEFTDLDEVLAVLVLCFIFDDILDKINVAIYQNHLGKF